MQRHLAIALASLALLYAAAASYRTVVDTDIGWQMAAGRYLVEHGRLPRTDVFSYTAPGQEWIYPAGAGLIFYLVHQAGGFQALTLLGVLACMGTVAILLRGAGAGRSALAALAVPAVAFATLPRAAMFTTVLFAAMLSVLWHFHRHNRAPLWLLPLLMTAWVNLHPGFISGLALLAAYAAMEICERAAGRLRQAAPWLVAAAASTLLNPWGLRIYEAVWRQREIQQVHDVFISEWARSTAVLSAAFAWRSPLSAYAWLLAAGIVAAAGWILRRRPGRALLLAGAAGASLFYARFQGLYVLTAVLLAGTLLDEADCTRRPVWVRAGWVAAGLVAVLSFIRITDLVTNRYYLSSGEIATFGAGPTWWYPERAGEAVRRERLPGRVFNNFNIGGYLIWKLAPEYTIYIDGRAVPFGPELFFRNAELMQLPPDSPEWLREADLRGIEIVMFPVARYAGAAGALLPYCYSANWRLVHLDETAAVFLRNHARNQPWLQRLSAACDAASFSPPPGAGRARLYHFHANAAWVMHALGRHAEALESLDRAAKLFGGDEHLLLTRGAVLQAAGRTGDAEREFRRALELSGSAEARYAIGVAQANQGRLGEAAENISRAARAAGKAEYYRMLGDVYLAAKEPRRALEAFDDAERSSPFRELVAGPGANSVANPGSAFLAELAAGRARATYTLGDKRQALAFQREAVRLAPRNAAHWTTLAELYDALGESAQAHEARRRAASTAATHAAQP